MGTIVLLVFLVAIAVPAQSAPAGGVLRFNSSYSPPYSTEAGDGILERILTEALGRLNYEVEFVRLPAERALLDAENGSADGVVARVAGIEHNYPNLIFVPSATIPQRDFVAFTADERVAVRRWADLSGRRVAIVRGWKIVEANVPGSAEATRAASTAHAFRLLERGRVEVVINARLDGLAQAEKLGMKVFVQEPPLASLSLYPYLHARHRDLVPLLAASLDDLKEQSLFDAVYEEAMSRFEMGSR